MGRTVMFHSTAHFHQGAWPECGKLMLLISRTCKQAVCYYCTISLNLDQFYLKLAFRNVERGNLALLFLGFISRCAFTTSCFFSRILMKTIFKGHFSKHAKTSNFKDFKLVVFNSSQSYLAAALLVGILLVEFSLQV